MARFLTDPLIGNGLWSILLIYKEAAARSRALFSVMPQAHHTISEPRFLSIGILVDLIMT